MLADSPNPASKNRLSLALVLLTIVLMVVVRLLVPRWETNNVLAILSWDVLGYYMYLPSVFVYNDLLKLEYVDYMMETYRPTGSFYQAFLHENGNMVMKYPIGVAVLYLPFFLLADLVAAFSGYERDGFSAPYQFAIGMSAVVYAAFGLLLLRKILLRYFSDLVTFLALFILLFGSNYLQYVVIDGAMPHGYLFTGYVLTIWLSIRWHKEKNWKQALGLGLTIGLCAITRPTEILLILIPLFWGMTSIRTPALKERVAEWWAARKQIALAALGVFLMACIQMGYWKYATGDFIFYSYQEYGFDWLHPHFWEVLLDDRKGWLVYTPLMWLGLLGFGFLYRRLFTAFWPMTVYFAINMYVVCAWTIWWYGGSYSCRALVQVLPIVAFALAALMSFVVKRKSLLVVLGLVLTFFIPLNLFQLWQYNNEILPANAGNLRYLKAVMFKTEVSKEAALLLSTRGSIKDESPYEKKLLFFENFDTDTNFVHRNNWLSLSGRYSLKSTPENNFESVFSYKRSEFPKEEDTWLKISFNFFSKWGAPNSKFIVEAHEANEEKTSIKWTGIRLKSAAYKTGEWEDITFYWKLPPAREKDYDIWIYPMCGGAPLFFDDIEVELLVRE